MSTIMWVHGNRHCLLTCFDYPTVFLFTHKTTNSITLDQLGFSGKVLIHQPFLERIISSKSGPASQRRKIRGIGSGAQIMGFYLTSSFLTLRVPIFSRIRLFSTIWAFTWDSGGWNVGLSSSVWRASCLKGASNTCQ
jgi:hypothetical protein